MIHSRKKNDKLDFIIIVNFCESDFQKNEKISHRLGEKTFTKHISDKGPVFQMYKVLLELKK